MEVTDPSYISQQMFDKVLQEAFLDNPVNEAVEQQARKLIQLFRNSTSHLRVLSGVVTARNIARFPKWFGHKEELTIEIAFAMGLQCGFELALRHPPLDKSLR